MVNCGRRWGKSEYGTRKLAEAALQGEPVAYLAPIYPMVTEVYRALVDRLAPVIERRVEGRRLELVGGGVIDLWSMENGADRIRGRKYRRAVLDECALVTDLLAVWEKVVRPTLTDLRGDALFLSTPRRGGGFQALYDRGQGEDEDWRSWQMPTRANPFIDPEEIEAARAGMSEQAFRQEFEADFEASESDLVFPEFNATMIRSAAVSWLDCKWRIVGIDPGGGDPTAIVPLGVYEDRKRGLAQAVHQYGEFYRKGDVDIDALTAFLSRLGQVDVIAVGETNGNILVNSLAARGFPAYKADLRRGEGIESVRWLLQSGLFSIEPGCKNSIAEFAGYRWAKRRDPETGDRFATSTPFDHHADAMDARRYAVMALLQGLPSGGGEVKVQWR